MVFKTQSNHARYHKTGVLVYLEDGTYESPERVTSKICEVCGNKVTYRGEDSRKFCSLKCSGISNRVVDRPSKKDLKELLNKYSFSKVGRMFGVTGNTIRKWCVSYDLPTDPGYYDNDEKNKIRSEAISKRMVNKNGREVGKYSLDGELIKVYPSVAEAMRDMNNQGIKSALAGRQKTSAGYKWKYMS